MQKLIEGILIMICTAIWGTSLLLITFYTISKIKENLKKKRELIEKEMIKKGIDPKKVKKKKIESKMKFITKKKWK